MKFSSVSKQQFDIEFTHHDIEAFNKEFGTGLRKAGGWLLVGVKDGTANVKLDLDPGSEIPSSAMVDPDGDVVEKNIKKEWRRFIQAVIESGYREHRAKWHNKPKTISFI